MIDPVLVETVRGGRVDLSHRGALVVSDADGRVVWSVGDIDRRIYPRSAAKLFQALPLVESGAADRFGLSDRHLALACASHSAEKTHLEEAAAMLKAAGLDEPDLGCGAHWPLHSQQQLIDYARAGRVPDQLWNTCSGKHAGFLCAACHQDFPTAGYTHAEHEIQRQAKAAQEAMTGFSIAEDDYAIDGCAIPVFAFPLRALALGFARVATGEGMSPGRSAAAKRLLDACIAHPWHTAGTDRFCTHVIEAGQGAIYAKFGADGVYVASLPLAGLGVALKCDDGSDVAAKVMLIAVLMRLFEDDDAVRERLAPLARRALTNWNGAAVGEMRPVSD